jgi:hypothetical protein
MITLDKSELQAIVLLKRIPEFKAFLDILNREASTLSYSSAVIKDEVVMRWTQGKFQEVMDLINRIKTADEELHSFRPEARKHVE